MSTSHRLSAADFAEFRPFKRQNGRFFSISIGRREDGPKWACVVSKKVSSRAVARNLVKRRCRAIVGALLKGYRGQVAIVVQARRGAAEATFQDTRQDLTALLISCGLVDGASSDAVR